MLSQKQYRLQHLHHQLKSAGFTLLQPTNVCPVGIDQLDAIYHLVISGFKMAILSRGWHSRPRTSKRTNALHLVLLSSACRFLLSQSYTLKCELCLKITNFFKLVRQSKPLFQRHDRCLLDFSRAFSLFPSKAHKAVPSRLKKGGDIVVSVKS